MIGLGASQGLPLPAEQLVDSWSEPPYATVGLGTGTMASYARWLQHLTYYEIDDKILRMNIPPERDGVQSASRYFLTVRDALYERNANIEIVMGDAAAVAAEGKTTRQGVGEEHRHPGNRPGPTPLRDNYYKFLNLDAFSSDAIPVHLITKEAIELYMSKLTIFDGVLMVHTFEPPHEPGGPGRRHLQEAGPIDAIVGKDHGGDERTKRNWPAIACRSRTCPASESGRWGTTVRNTSWWPARGSCPVDSLKNSVSNRRFATARSSRRSVVWQQEPASPADRPRGLDADHTTRTSGVRSCATSAATTKSDRPGWSAAGRTPGPSLSEGSPRRCSRVPVYGTLRLSRVGPPLGERLPALFYQQVAAPRRRSQRPMNGAQRGTALVSSQFLPLADARAIAAETQKRECSRVPCHLHR